MRMIRKLRERFEAAGDHDLRIDEVARALSDHETRSRWLDELLTDLTNTHLAADQALLSKDQARFADLCARRRAIQDVLSLALRAQRTKPKDPSHNPLPVYVDLDRVTA